MDTIQYTHDWFKKDLRNIIDQLVDKKYDLLIGINRGGCIPAVCLSHALKTPVTMIDYSTRDGINIHPTSLHTYFEKLPAKNILIVDDLIDSGKSIEEVTQIATTFCDVSVATLLYNVDVNITIPHYWGTSFSRKNESRYFTFWWEEL